MAWQDVLASSPLFAYRLDDPDSTMRSAIGGENGTHPSGSSAAGALGSAPGSRLYTATGASLLPAASSNLSQAKFSVECWIETGSGAVVQWITTKGGDISNRAWALYVNGATPKDLVGAIYNASGANQLGTLTAALASNTAYHLCLTVDMAANTSALYLNGALRRSGGSSSMTTSPAPISIGGASDGTRNYNGRIADWAYFDRVLTASEISDHVRQVSLSADITCGAIPI